LGDLLIKETTFRVKERSMITDKGRFAFRSLRDLLIKETNFTGCRQEEERREQEVQTRDGMPP
jgi:hypothetical protein